MSGTTGNDSLTGTSGADAINGGGGNDTIVGLGGNDTLNGDGAIPGSDGTDGADSVLGDAGNDSLIGEGGNDTLRGGADNDTLLGGNGLDWLFGDAGNDSIVGDGEGGTGSDPDTIDGGTGNDTIVGANGADSILGGTGNDIVSGGGGADVIRGGDGNDTIEGGDGNDTIEGGAGADVFVETGGTGGGIDELSYASDTAGVNVNLVAGAASGGHAQGDVFSGNQFENLRGGSGNDTLVGSTHRDNILYGGAGNDSITTNLGDSAFGEDGNDTLIGSPEAGSGNEDYLDGGAGNDYIAARGGNDTVVTGAGDDTVRVGIADGNDSLNGGPEDGRDILDLENWSGPADFGTDDLADGVYGDWTVAGGTGTNAVRTFTYSTGGGPVTANISATDFEGITCFAEGTLIATARGEVPVETLRAGDLVLTAHAGAALLPLVWVGHTTVDVARHPNPARVAPVVIKAGALAEGVPFRDLRVSPDHGLYLDGRLVPAALLVNGTTIVQETWCHRVTYWHAELPHHGLLVSEGAVTESYFDDGNRHLFDNAGIAAFAVDFAAHRPNGRYAAAACAPVVAEDDVVLDRIRARIAARVPARRATA